MDKHSKLWELLPDDVKPDLSQVIASADREAIIEHAAIVFLMGRGWSLSPADDPRFVCLHKGTDMVLEPFADALLAAVERETKGVGNV